MMAFSKLVLVFLGNLVGQDYALTMALADEPMAVLYEKSDKSGISVNYFEETEDYGHIQSLVDKRGMSGLGMICATGVFILYNQEEFGSDSDDEVAILAGKATCLPPGLMLSIMFAQSYDSTTLDSIAVFDTERFGGDVPLKITSQTAFNEASLIQMGQINSFILMGNSGWTITTRFRTFCIKPSKSSDYPVCPVPHSEDFFHAEELNWLSATQGCDEDDMDAQMISLNYCFNHGSGKLEPISTDQSRPGVPDESNEDGGRQKGNSKDPIFEKCAVDHRVEIATLTKLRLTHDFDSMYQIQFPLNKAHTWRTEILDYTMEIVNECVVDELVDRKMLRFIRELYIYFAEKLVWKEGKGWPTKPRQRIWLVGHETARCLTHITENGWVAVALKLSEELLNSMDRAGIKDSDIDIDFLPLRGLDIVMDFIWLSINYVGGACHAALEYETDFWMDYMNVAYEMYLRPMTDFWSNPGQVLKYYPIILGGYGLNRQHRGLAAATSALYKTLSLDKLTRPPNVRP